MISKIIQTFFIAKSISKFRLTNLRQQGYCLKINLKKEG